MAIFPPEKLRAFASEVSPWEILDHKLDLLRQLCNRHSGGWLDAASETSVEQSFNERLFAEIFDYRTLFRDGYSHYHLRPKNYHQRSGRYDDFALGHFRLDGGTTEVLAELKAPDTDLDRQQTGGGYQGKTPVEQAFTASKGNESVRWLVISNFDEVRLYHASNKDDYERVILSKIITPADFMRAYSLLGRPNLIGQEAGIGSRLASLFSGGPPIVLEPKEGCIRLIQESRVTTPPKPRWFLSEIYDKVQLLDPFLDASHWSQQLQVSDDRIVLIQGLQRDGTPTRHRVEITMNGIIRSSQLLPFANAFYNEPEPPKKDFSVAELGQAVYKFVCFSNDLLHALGAQRLTLEFRLVDLQGARVTGVRGDEPSAHATATGDYSQAWLDLDITTRRPATVEDERKWWTSQVVSELVFRFGASDDFGKWQPTTLGHDFESRFGSEGG